MVVKSISSVSILAYDSSSELGLLAFGIGQFAFSITLFLIYLRELRSETFFSLRRSATGESAKKE